jgi:hypothetical protein
MEIDITPYMTQYDCRQYANSVAESGMQNIGRITWDNAMRHVSADHIVTGDQLEHTRDWLAEFGAWSEEELAEMSDQEINALLIQFIAGDVREIEAYDDWEDYEQAADDGQVSGRIYRGDDGKFYFYVGN